MFIFFIHPEKKQKKDTKFEGISHLMKDFQKELKNEPRSFENEKRGCNVLSQVI
jgi:hypothetical protein